MSEAHVDLAGIPDAAKPLWGQLVKGELIPVHELFTQVRHYQQAIAQRSETGHIEVDPKLANALVDASLKLLGTLHEDTPDGTRLLIQAAVRYFVIEEDADSDLDSILGLDDDAEVLNAVLDHLGHHDWTVELV